MKNAKDLLKIGLLVFLCGILIMDLAGSFLFQARIPKFPPSVIDQLEVQIRPDDTALAQAPSVTTKTSARTAKKKVTLSKAATRSYTKNLGTKTFTQTSSSETPMQAVKVDTTKAVKTTEKYTKGSKIKVVCTSTKTTVTTTTVFKAPEEKEEVVAAAKSADVSMALEAPATAVIQAEAPLMDARVLRAFEAVGFKLVIDPAFTEGEGVCNCSKGTITMRRAKTSHIYHELGHFLGFIAGRIDEKGTFKAIYNEEKGNFPGIYKGYASQNSSEFFAECTREYVLHRAELKAACPKSYAAIEEAMEKLTEAQLLKVKRTYAKYWTQEV